MSSIPSPFDLRPAPRQPGNSFPGKHHERCRPGLSFHNRPADLPSRREPRRNPFSPRSAPGGARNAAHRHSGRTLRPASGPSRRKPLRQDRLRSQRSPFPRRRRHRILGPLPHPPLALLHCFNSGRSAGTAGCGLPRGRAYPSVHVPRLLLLYRQRRRRKLLPLPL